LVFVDDASTDGTWDQIMASNLDLFPKSFDYDLSMGVPPLPVPGVYKFS